MQNEKYNELQNIRADSIETASNSGYGFFNNVYCKNDFTISTNYNKVSNARAMRFELGSSAWGAYSNCRATNTYFKGTGNNNLFTGCIGSPLLTGTIYYAACIDNSGNVWSS